MPQSLANIIVHLVFSTKNRTPVIMAPFSDDLHEYCGGILRMAGCNPIRIGSADDHMHLLFALSRTHTVAATVEQLKTSSCKWLKERLCGDNTFRWQNGYGVFSIQASNVQRVVRYIENQRLHHRQQSFQEEYRKILQTNGLHFDENYVWD